jgi:hypothetical protein
MRSIPEREYSDDDLDKDWTDEIENIPVFIDYNAPCTSTAHLIQNSQRIPSTVQIRKAPTIQPIVPPSQQRQLNKTETIQCVSYNKDTTSLREVHHNQPE